MKKNIKHLKISYKIINHKGVLLEKSIIHFRIGIPSINEIKYCSINIGNISNIEISILDIKDKHIIYKISNSHYQSNNNYVNELVIPKKNIYNDIKHEVIVKSNEKVLISDSNKFHYIIRIKIMPDEY